MEGDVKAQCHFSSGYVYTGEYSCHWRLTTSYRSHSLLQSYCRTAATLYALAAGDLRTLLRMVSSIRLDQDNRAL